MVSHPRDKATQPAAEQTALALRATAASVSVALLLFILKVTIGLSSASISVLASALDSGFDVFTSVVNLLAVRAASKPADKEHRYGHGKAEALAGFVQSILIAFSGLYLAWRSVDSFIHPHQINQGRLALVVMAVSLLLTVGLVFYQKHVISKTKSLAIEADSLHYVTDIASNSATMAALAAFIWFDLTSIDSVVGLILSLYIVVSAASILKRSTAILLDEDVSDRYRQTLLEVLEGYKDITGYHDLRSRSAGNVDFLDFHLEISHDISMEKSHEIVEQVSDDIRRRFSHNLDIIIHTDPVVADDHGNTVQLFDKKPPSDFA